MESIGDRLERWERAKQGKALPPDRSEVERHMLLVHC